MTLSKDEFIKNAIVTIVNNPSSVVLTETNMLQYDIYKLPLYIVAQKRDFTIENKNKIHETNIPDPIVLYPVVYNNNMYYLIVTAWEN
jgi:hypothetical protein